MDALQPLGRPNSTPIPDPGATCGSLVGHLWGSADVDAVEVVGPEGGVALGALPLPGVVAALDALEAEDVEALGQHRVLLAGVAAGAGQPGLRGAPGGQRPIGAL